MSIGEILKWIEFIRRIIDCLTNAGVITAESHVPIDNGHLHEITRAMARTVVED